MLGHELQVEVLAYLNAAQVHLEDFFTFLQFGQFHMDLTVEATGTHEGLVQDIGTVGSRQHDDAAVGTEAVHLGE